MDPVTSPRILSDCVHIDRKVDQQTKIWTPALADPSASWALAYNVAYGLWPRPQTARLLTQERVLEFHLFKFLVIWHYYDNHLIIFSLVGLWYCSWATQEGSQQIYKVFLGDFQGSLLAQANLEINGYLCSLSYSDTKICMSALTDTNSWANLWTLCLKFLTLHSFFWSVAGDCLHCDGVNGLGMDFL